MKKQTLIALIKVSIIVSINLTLIDVIQRKNNITKPSINNKETLISNKYNECEKTKKSLRFKEGLAVKIVNPKFGYIDEACNFIIKPEFGYAMNFSDGYGAVQIKEYLSSNPEWKFINKEGKFLEINKDQTIDPNEGEIIIEQTEGFEFGLAAVKVRGKWGFINTEGNFVIYPRFQNTTGFTNYTGNISAKVRLDKKDGWYRIKPDGSFYSW